MTPPRPTAAQNCLSATGEAAACARAVDWAQTPLGSIETWPQSLLTIVGTLLRARHPMFLYWGPELIQFYNDGYIPSFGAGKHPRAMGQRARECWPEIWPLIGPQIEDVMLRSGTTWHEDQLIPIYRNGRLEDVYWTYGYSPVYDESGGVGGTLVVVTETTARVVAERRLRASRLLTERTSALLDGPELVQAAMGAFHEMSRDVTFSLVFSFERNELTLAGYSGLTGAELAQVEPLVRDRLPSAREAEHSRGGRAAARTLSLPEFTRADTAPDALFTPLWPPGEHGATVGFAAFGVNAMQIFDAQYRQHIEELGETLSLACARQTLRAEQRKIQERLVLTDRLASVGTLAAGAAHELNTPLACVATNLDLMLEEIHALNDGSQSGHVRELEGLAQAARDGAGRVAEIVRALKTFSGAESEQRVLLELQPLLELSIDMAFHEIRRRARLVKAYGPAPRVEADAAQLSQVFINLLVNAAQAIPEGDADTQEICVLIATDSGGNATIEVRDTGPGIPASVIGRIFEPFFTTKAVGVGTGLGLSICHNIVSGLGGELTVKSAAQRGTSFLVTLPASTRSVEPAIRLPSREANRKAGRAHVLIVDDEPALGLMLGRVLRNHVVTIVTSAHEALELIVSGAQFDVILSDLMMPLMSGVELYEELAKRFPDAAERLVFVTGGASTPAAKAFLARVPNERIDKPFETKQVRALVERFVT
ncbi:MAG: ATP-binding protein [Polyangiaceae bacterium]